MAKSKIPYESLSISDKIEVKRKKIQRLFRDLPAERKQFADGLIYQFAVTTVTLERLVEEINAGDLIEDFKQGAQQLRRETPALKSYNNPTQSSTLYEDKITITEAVTIKAKAYADGHTASDVLTAEFTISG